MKLIKKAASITMVLILGVFILTGCKDKTTKTIKIDETKTTEVGGSTTPETKETPETPEKVQPMVYRRTAATIDTLSPHQFTMNTTSVVLNDISAALYDLVYDPEAKNMKFNFELAAGFPTTADGVTWQIPIKEGATFTNGNPITAETIEYSWRMLADPLLASPQAASLYGTIPIKNTEAYFLRLSEADYVAYKEDENTDWKDIEKSDTPVTWEEVGIKATDPFTLEIVLDSKFNEIDLVYHFSSSSAMSVVDPEMYEASMNADRTENTYGTTLENLAQSGRYILVDWVKDQYRVYEKNEDWIGVDVYTPDVIEELEISDANAVVQLFNSGEIDVLSPAGATAEEFLEDPRSLRTEGPVVWGFYVNMLSETNPVLHDINMRKAIYYAVDRESIARDVYKVYIPANYFVSRRAIVGDIMSDAERYRDTTEGMANQEDNMSFDVVRAKEFFDAAYEGNGNKKIVIELTYFDTSESQKKCAEVLKEDFEKIFGEDKFELSLRAMPTAAAYDTYKARTYDMGFGTMSQNSFNPWSSLKNWTSFASNKSDTLYNADFDALQRSSATGELVTDPAGRLKALGEMEGILLKELPWIPIYQNDGVVVYADRIHIITDQYITGVAYAPLQAEMENNVERKIKVR